MKLPATASASAAKQSKRNIGHPNIFSKTVFSVSCAYFSRYSEATPDYQIDDAVLKAIYEDDLSEKTANYTFCYRAGAVGFTSPEWCGHPTEIW